MRFTRSTLFKCAAGVLFLLGAALLIVGTSGGESPFTAAGIILVLASGAIGFMAAFERHAPPIILVQNPRVAISAEHVSIDMQPTCTASAPESAAKASPAAEPPQAAQPVAGDDESPR